MQMTRQTRAAQPKRMTMAQSKQAWVTHILDNIAASARAAKRLAKAKAKASKAAPAASVSAVTVHQTVTAKMPPSPTHAAVPPVSAATIAADAQKLAADLAANESAAAPKAD